MKLIHQKYEILDKLDGDEILKKLELCGRVCYKSEKAITEESAKRFVRNLIKRGHESVLEHISFSVRFITDRGITHEIVRHRLASYSQESTRYCAYKDELEFIAPLDMDYEAMKEFNVACKQAEDHYLRILKYEPPQVARDVLPTCIKSEIIMSANLREWRLFFKYRAEGVTGSPHPKIKALASDLLKDVKKLIPVVFDDIMEDADA